MSLLTGFSFVVIAVPVCVIGLVLLAALRRRKKGPSAPVPMRHPLEKLVERSYQLYCTYQRMDARYSLLSGEFHGQAGIFSAVQRLLALARYAQDDTDEGLVFLGLLENGLLPGLKAVSHTRPPFCMTMAQYRVNLGISDLDSPTARARLEESIAAKEGEIALLSGDPLHQRLDTLAQSLEAVAVPMAGAGYSPEKAGKFCAQLERILKDSGYTVVYPEDADAPGGEPRFPSGGAAGPLPAILYGGETICPGRG